MTNFDISFQTKTILSAFCFCARNDWWGFLEIWRTFPIKWKLISHNELRLKLFNTNRFSSILPIDGNYHVRWLYNLFLMLLLGVEENHDCEKKKVPTSKTNELYFERVCVCVWCLWLLMIVVRHSIVPNVNILKTENSVYSEQLIHSNWLNSPWQIIKLRNIDTSNTKHHSRMNVQDYITHWIIR